MEQLKFKPKSRWREFFGEKLILVNVSDATLIVPFRIIKYVDVLSGSGFIKNANTLWHRDDR